MKAREAIERAFRQVIIERISRLQVICMAFGCVHHDAGVVSGSPECGKRRGIIEKDGRCHFYKEAPKE